MLAARLLVTLGFLGALAVPAADTWARWSQQAPWTANRPRADWPSRPSTVKSVAKFPRRVDAFFEDNFGFRDTFIRWNSFVKVHWLHASPVPSVVIGKNQWLYYNVPGSGRTPAEYKQLDPFSRSELEAAQRILEQRQAALAAVGIRYLFVIPPNKHTIYPEYLPLSLALRDYGQRLDSFVRHMQTHSTVPVLDLRADLIRAKANTRFAPLYLRNDSHWNGHGGFVAYQAIARRLQEWFPGLPIVQHSHFQVGSSPRPGDLAVMLGMPDEWPDVDYDYLPKPSTPSPAPLRAFVYADSYGWKTKHFLGYSFEHVTFKQTTEGPFLVDEAVTAQARVVVDQRLERNLGAL